jgi:hypothetical protein
LAQATDLANTLATCSTQATTALDCQIKDIAKTDTSTYTSDQKTSLLDAIATLNAEYATLSADNAAIATITKDLNTYYVNIDQLNGQPSGLPSKTVTTPNFGNTATTTRIVTLGTISDPADAATKQFFIYKLLGRQVVFSANAVNQIGTFIASVPTAAQKKSIATITVLYADPILEASTGTFFSILPNRSFSNQTLVTQSAGGAPTLGNVVITQTISRPTIIPFVGANWRLGHDFLIGRRRGAFYLTAAIGLNPYNTTTEFGVGPSLSWRALMFSALYHEGHDVRLTQGEQLGEVWCNTSAANGSIPKCSGNPPAPSTEKFWTGTFAFGISVRVPSIFGSGSTGH